MSDRDDSRYRDGGGDDVAAMGLPIVDGSYEADEQLHEYSNMRDGSFGPGPE